MFVAVGGFDLDGLNESLCVCVNVTTCQISEGLRSLNTAAFELWENSNSWPAFILARLSQSPYPNTPRTVKSSVQYPVSGSKSVAALSKHEVGCIGPLCVTD